MAVKLANPKKPSHRFGAVRSAMSTNWGVVSGPKAVILKSCLESRSSKFVEHAGERVTGDSTRCRSVDSHPGVLHERNLIRCIESVISLKCRDEMRLVRSPWLASMDRKRKCRCLFRLPFGWSGGPKHRGILSLASSRTTWIKRSRLNRWKTVYYSLAPLTVLGLHRGWEPIWIILWHVSSVTNWWSNSNIW